MPCNSQTLCSERIPKEVLANLVTLLPHLDGPSYPMRSAIVTALGNIVAAVFAANQVRGWMCGPSPLPNKTNVNTWLCA